MPGQTFYNKKPYVFIPIVQNVRYNPVQSRQDALTSECGIIRVSITAHSPLHFGQGKLLADTSSSQVGFTHALSRENGRLVLPGSSFKGMLRAFFEAITNSCILFTTRNIDTRKALPVANRSVCPKKVEFDTPNTNKYAPNIGLCPACSIFGSLGYKGKLSFSPFYAREDTKIKSYVIPQLQTPFRDYPRDKAHANRGNERLYYGVLPGRHGAEVGNLTKQEFFDEKRKHPNTNIRFYGRKFYKHANKPEIGNESVGNTFECLEPGAVLEGTIGYQGLREEELAALVFSLGLGWATPIYHKLGYAKPAYFGSVSIAIEAIDMPERYRNIGVSRNTQSIKELAVRYRAGADGDVLSAIEAFEQTWSSLDEPSQWSAPQEGGQNRMY